jgi:hypothetical protein
VPLGFGIRIGHKIEPLHWLGHAAVAAFVTICVLREGHLPPRVEHNNFLTNIQ